MSSSRQPSRDSRRSRRPSINEPPEPSSYQTDSASKKRSYSNRYARNSVGYTSGYDEDYENDEPEDEDHTPHSGKRHRNSDWPLQGRSPGSVISARGPLRNRKVPNSPSVRHSSPPPRPSRFLEGSMNDRVSQKPPTPFLEHEDDLLERYDTERRDESRGRKLTRSQKYTQFPTPSEIGSSSNARSESRHRNIFQFGKSIAASFKPSNWKIFSKPQPLPETEEEAQLRLLRERQVKAEKIYKELKESGQFHDPNNGFQRFQQAGLQDAINNTPSKHDSGISFRASDSASIRGRDSLDVPRQDSRYDATRMHGQPSRENLIHEKRNSQGYLEPPNSRLRRGTSPAGSVVHSNPSTPGKRSSHFSKPSLSNLKKPSLANIKKAFASPSTHLESDDGYHSARRIPSRKDLQKQQKLVKRVSSLEGKLEAARRQLNQSLESGYTVGSSVRSRRPQFVPGALATLPSERLLAGYLNPANEHSELEDVDGTVIKHELNEIGDSMMSGGRGTEEHEVEDHDIRRESMSYAKRLPPPRARMTTFESRDTAGLKNRRSSDQFHRDGQEASMIPRPSRKVPAAPVSRYKAEDAEGEVEEDSEEEEPTPKMKSLRPMPAATEPPKKRKSLFERVADDGGNYQPSEITTTESEVESEIKKPKSRNNPPAAAVAATARPRKLQKTGTQDVSVSGSPSSPKNSKPHSGSQNSRHSRSKAVINAPIITLTGAKAEPSRKPSNGKLHKKTHTTVTSPPPSGHLPPRNKHVDHHDEASEREQEPVSENEQSSPAPPSGDFTLEYSASNNKSSHASNNKKPESAYIAEPNQDGVPPMPPMPKEVRLPNGEVVELGEVTKAKETAKIAMAKARSVMSSAGGPAISGGGDVGNRGVGKVVKRRPIGEYTTGSGKGRRKSGGVPTGPKEDFEWPEDVF